MKINVIFEKLNCVIKRPNISPAKNKIISTKINNGIKCHFAVYEQKFNNEFIKIVMRVKIKTLNGRICFTFSSTNFESEEFRNRNKAPRKIPKKII